MHNSDMNQVKILMNSNISSSGAQWVGVDIKYFWPNMSFLEYEYLYISIHLFLQDIIDAYSLAEKFENGNTMA